MPSASKINNFDRFVFDCEREIITSILNDSKAIQNVVLSLSVNDFCDASCQKIIDVMFTLNNHGIIVNKNNVIDYFINNKKYQFSNWKEQVEILANDFASDDDLKTNIEIVYNASTKRQLDRLASQILKCNLDKINYSDKIYELQKNFFDIIERNKKDNLFEISIAANETYKKLISLMNRKNEITGIPVGFNNIDKLTNGFQNEDLIILAARPSVGKTTLSINFLLNAAKFITNHDKEKKDRIIYFSLEMGRDQIIKKMISILSGIDSNKLRTGFLDSNEQDSLKTTINDITSLPILIDDSASTSITDIQARLKQISNTNRIRMVIIDYLQLIRGLKVPNSIYNRQQEVSNISKMLKQFAREFKCPIIALAQLSRDIEKRDNKAEPRLSDLRESGAIEQDADLVTFISRSISNNDLIQDDDEALSAIENNQKKFTSIKFIIAKHRNGPTDTVNLTLLNTTGLFVEDQTNKHTI